MDGGVDELFWDEKVKRPVKEYFLLNAIIVNGVRTNPLVVKKSLDRFNIGSLSSTEKTRKHRETL